MRDQLARPWPVKMSLSMYEKDRKAYIANANAANMPNSACTRAHMKCHFAALKTSFQVWERFIFSLSDFMYKCMLNVLQYYMVMNFFHEVIFLAWMKITHFNNSDGETDKKCCASLLYCVNE